MKLLKTGLSAKGFAKVEAIRSLESVLLEVEGDARPEALRRRRRPPAPLPRALPVHHLRHAVSHRAVGLALRRAPHLAELDGGNGSGDRDAAVLRQQPRRGPRRGPKTGLRVLAAEEDLGPHAARCRSTRTASGGVVDPRRAQRRPHDQQAQGRSAARRRRRRLQRPDAGPACSADGSLIEVPSMPSPTSLGQSAHRDDQEGRHRHRSSSRGWASPRGRDRTTTACRAPEFAIEYDNTQNNNNHIHAVWRDYDGDFGRDLLAAHYKSRSRLRGPGSPLICRLARGPLWPARGPPFERASCCFAALGARRRRTRAAGDFGRDLLAEHYQKTITAPRPPVGLRPRDSLECVNFQLPTPNSQDGRCPAAGKISWELDGGGW